ncbi:MAG: hypothetical protein IJN42_06045 [Clostridia bacterium]|nr:hypothetical protein [Clostridia bacterium]
MHFQACSDAPPLLKNVTLFYVGNHGQFDTLVCRMLKTICQQYPVHYFVVTAYLPTKQSEYENDSHFLYPDGLETVPPKYAIVRRNDWMLNQADYVVTCIDDPFGCSARMQEKAIKKGKTIIRLGKY